MFLKKIIFFLFFVLSAYAWFDFKKINYNYVNYPLITYEKKNINNPYIKNIVNFIDEAIEYFQINYVSAHKNYYKIENPAEREKLPEFKILLKETDLTPSIVKQNNNLNNWVRSHGNNTSNRFSDLKFINNKNVSNLDIAWTYTSYSGYQDIQCNPIVVDGIIYTPIPGGYVAAINGATGKELWKFRIKENDTFQARRGLTYWEGDKNNKPRIFFSSRENLISLNAENGTLVNSFGKNGIVKRTGLNVMAPVIYKNEVIIATWNHAVEAYNIINGKNTWNFKFRKYNHKRYGGKIYKNKGGNPWGGMSLDEKRGILFLTTGNPHDFWEGVNRPGNNPDTNSVIAIDLNKKNKIWSFQEVRHDLWNSDLAAPPILTTITKNKKLYDVVVVPTKKGNTLILDRLKGTPVFDFRLRRAPTSKIPGEKTSPYQPDLVLPEPFMNLNFSSEQLFFRDKNNEQKFKNELKNSDFGFYQTYELEKNVFQIEGGTLWYGASVDHNNSIMYVTSSRHLLRSKLNKLPNSKPYLTTKYFSELKQEMDTDGYPVIVPPWGNLTALNLNTGKIVWSKPFGNHEAIQLASNKLTGTENFGGATGTAGNIIIATGTLDKKIYIYNTDDGKILWSYTMPYIGSAPPTTYMAKGEQYIIVHSTGGMSLAASYPKIVKKGNLLMAFKIKSKN